MFPESNRDRAFGRTARGGGDCLRPGGAVRGAQEGSRVTPLRRLT